MLKHILASLVNYVMPFRCASCLELTNEHVGLCGKCFQKLNFISAPFCKICGFPFEFKIQEDLICGKCITHPPKYDISRSLFKFDENSKRLIYAFKYNDKTKYAKMFARLLSSRYKMELADIDIIVPVPMYKWKRVFRNYNPPQILAYEISKLISKPMIPDLLIKRKRTLPQTGLNKANRSKNLRGSIIFSEKYNIKNKKILLVDDVKTTGATSNMCSNILKKSGAEKVKLFTISLS